MEHTLKVASLITIAFLAAVSAFAADKVDVKGMITTRTGDTLTVKSREGTATNRQTVLPNLMILMSRAKPR